MIFLSLIMDLLMAFGIGVGDVQAQHHGDPTGAHGHTIHGHDTIIHHGRHGHNVGPSGHEPQNPHGNLPR